MISTILNSGDKIDLAVFHQADRGSVLGATYKSSLYDILDNGNLEIAMPTEGGKLVLLHLGIRYEMVFYAKTGLFRCIGQVKERYKSDNLYILQMEVKSQLTKFQRREYYRFKCSLDTNYIWIEEDEAKNIHADSILRVYMDENKFLPIQATAVDLSGGGIRFISLEYGKKNDYLLLTFLLKNENIDREIRVSGKLLQCNKLESDIARFEYRVQFIGLNSKLREMIIKYIFDEERKKRRNNKGM